MTSERKNTDEVLSDARLQLKAFLREPDYEVMTNEQGPLTIDQLPGQIRRKQAFQETVQRVGWPSYRDDKDTLRPQRYETDIEFLEALRPVDEYGPNYVASSHFFQMLRVTPKSPPVSQDQFSTVYDMYGLYPVIHRGYAVAPEFLNSLRIVVDDLFQKHRELSNDDLLNEALLQPQNETVVAAMHAAYRLMARLVKNNDSETLDELLAKQFGKSERGKIHSPVVIPEDLLLHGETGTIW